MNNSNQQPQVNNPWQTQYNTQWQHQDDSQQQPPSYAEAIQDSSQTGYSNYAQSYPQPPAAYPVQQGYGGVAGYDQAKSEYPKQVYQQGAGYTNYAQQPYYPPPAASSNNQSVIVTQNAQNVVVDVRNYLGLAILAVFLFLPTGIMAVLRANEAQNQFRMGNIDRAQAANLDARKLIRISFAVAVVLIIISIVCRVVANSYYY